MKEQKGIFRHIDRRLVLLYLTLVLMGWANIYAAVYNNEHASIFDLSQSYGKQLLWIGTSLLLALMVILTDAKFFNAFAYPIYIGTIVLLVFVLAPPALRRMMYVCRGAWWLKKNICA